MIVIRLNILPDNPDDYIFDRTQSVARDFMRRLSIFQWLTGSEDDRECMDEVWDRYASMPERFRKVLAMFDGEVLTNNNGYIYNTLR